VSLEPVLAVGDFNFKGNVEFDGALHATHEQPLHFIEFTHGGIHNQFVMDLHDQTALHPAHFSRHVNHGQLDDVGSRSLDGRVDGIALCKGANNGIVAVDVGEGPASAQQGFGHA